MGSKAGLTLCFVFLGACTAWPLSESDCKPAGWRASGYAHGFSGAPAQDLRIVPECRRLYGVEVPQAEYLAGWREGHDEWQRLMGAMDVR